MPSHKHPEEAEPDNHFHWTTPDDGTQLEFSRNRTAVLQMAREWDLCISGDGLTHLQQIGEEAAFIPLAQVSAVKTSCLAQVLCQYRLPAKVPAVVAQARSRSNP